LAYAAILAPDCYLSALSRVPTSGGLRCVLAPDCGEAKEKINLNTLAKIDNVNVFISIIKTSEDGKSMIIRLRSLSDKPEKVNLSFPSFKPISIRTSLQMKRPVKKQAV